MVRIPLHTGAFESELDEKLARLTPKKLTEKNARRYIFLTAGVELIKLNLREKTRRIIFPGYRKPSGASAATLSIMELRGVRGQKTRPSLASKAGERAGEFLSKLANDKVLYQHVKNLRKTAGNPQASKACATDLTMHVLKNYWEFWKHLPRNKLAMAPVNVVKFFKEYEHNLGPLFHNDFELFDQRFESRIK